MYKTLKVRIDADAEIKSKLLEYELLYHRALQHYVGVMIRRKKQVKFFQHSILYTIAKHSQYLLYKEACRRYAYFARHGCWEFTRSSIWSAQDVTLMHRCVILYFPDIFAMRMLKLPIACETEEWKVLDHQRIVRIDIVHDDSYWFCNIVYEENVQSG